MSSHYKQHTDYDCSFVLHEITSSNANQSFTNSEIYVYCSIPQISQRVGLVTASVYVCPFYLVLENTPSVEYCPEHFLYYIDPWETAYTTFKHVIFISFLYKICCFIPLTLALYMFVYYLFQTIQ